MTREGYFIGNCFFDEEVQDVCDICGEPIEDKSEAITIEDGREKVFCSMNCYIEYSERFGDVAFDI